MTARLPYPFDVGPPWAKVTPARWGWYVTFGSAPLLVAEAFPGAPKRWWRRTRPAAERKARRLIARELDRQADRGWYVGT